MSFAFVNVELIKVLHYDRLRLLREAILAIVVCLSLLLRHACQLVLHKLVQQGRVLLETQLEELCVEWIGLELLLKLLLLQLLEKSLLLVALKRLHCK